MEDAINNVFFEFCFQLDFINKYTISWIGLDQKKVEGIVFLFSFIWNIISKLSLSHKRVVLFL